MSYHRTSSISYGASTQSNPFAQGGWKAISQSEEKSTRRDFSSKCGPAVQSSYGALPLAWSPIVQTKLMPLSTSTTIRFTPSTSTNSRSVNCTIVGPRNRVLYTVATENPSLTIVKDSERHPVALVEWSSMPVVDIRGEKGKKRLDQWLIPDSIIPNVQLMSWKGVWYSWTADQKKKLSLCTVSIWTSSRHC